MKRAKSVLVALLILSLTWAAPVVAKDAPKKSAPPTTAQCKQGTQPQVKAAQDKVKNAEAKLNTAKTAQKAAAKKDVDTAKAALAKIDCKGGGTKPANACKPAPASQISAADKRVKDADVKYSKSKKAADKKAADDARTAYAKVAC